MMAVKKKWKIRLAVLLALAVVLGLEIYRSNCCLTVDHYRIESAKVTESLRVLHLTDLHNASFGEDNGDLLAKAREQQPDLILFTGDLVTGSVKETDTAMKLLEELVKIAPVYVSVGNHELIHQSNFGSDVLGMMESRGVTVLDFQHEEIEVKGQRLRIGGLFGYCVPDIYEEARGNETAYLKDFQDTEELTLLMCHMPACWILNDGISYWDVDIVFSGHVHGGQFIIPFIGGVVGPDMGWFPGNIKGIFPSQDGTKHLVLSSGLGNSIPIPRLNNPPQMVVVDIVPG